MSRDRTVWSEDWQSPEAWIRRFESALRAQGATAMPGGEWDLWDLAVRGGSCGGVRTHVVVEEHGAGRQLLRTRVRAKVPVFAVTIVLVSVALAASALADGAWVAGSVFALVAAGVSWRGWQDCSIAARFWWQALATVRADASLR